MFKSILILMFLLLMSPFSRAAEIECENRRQYLGVYPRECPINAVVTGVDVRVTGSNYIWVYVECERHTTICKELVQKKVDLNKEVE